MPVASGEAADSASSTPPRGSKRVALERARQDDKGRGGGHLKELMALEKVAEHRRLLQLRQSKRGAGA